MPSEVDIANQALSGLRDEIASLSEDSVAARAVSLHFGTTRDALLRMAPWNCATNTNLLALICSAPGTPENPTQVLSVWAKGTPPPPWAYEYAYPSDCLRPLWIIPQQSTGLADGIPITTAITGGAPQFWTGAPAKFKVAIDQIGSDGLPTATGGSDTRIILTNQQQAILTYIKQVTDPGVWDPQFQEAMIASLAMKLAAHLTGDKALAKDKQATANAMIQIARAGDGNEGITVNDITPDWIRIRGITYSMDGLSPQSQFDFGPMWNLF